MHIEAYDWFHSEVALLAPRRVVEIGSKNINGSLRSLFASLPYIGVDVRAGRDVDVVASGTDFVPPWAPDTVLCAEVLEHVDDPTGHDICQNILRMLAPRGVALLSMACDPRAPHSAVNGHDLLAEDAEFYRNVTTDLLRDWLDGFGRVVWSQHRRGDLYVRAVKAP